MFKSPYYFNPYLWKMSRLHFSLMHSLVHLFSCNYGVIHSLSLLTSWPGRSIPLHISWRTRPRSPAPSPHSTLSRRHRLWHRGSSPHRCSAFLWCSGRCARKKNGWRTQSRLFLKIFNGETRFSFTSQPGVSNEPAGLLKDIFVNLYKAEIK